MQSVKYFNQTMPKKPPSFTSIIIEYAFKEGCPRYDECGISKIVNTHISNLHRLCVEWFTLINDGKKFCSAIVDLKLHKFNKDYYPPQVKPLCDHLTYTLYGLNTKLDGVRTIHYQLDALAQLQPGDAESYSWNLEKIRTIVSKIHLNMEKEYKLKETVTENIAHCRDQNLSLLYACSWGFDMYFNIDIGDYMFEEYRLPLIMKQ